MEKRSEWGSCLVTLCVILGCERANPNFLGDMRGSPTGPQCGNTTGMQLVPRGTFKMGATYLSENEKPLTEYMVEEFWMDQTEVTVQAFDACIRAGVCTEPDTGSNCNWKMAGRDQHPVNCVDWNQARTYCAWQCKRQPTEIEWEYAARGAMASDYPWGYDSPHTVGKPETDLCWKGSMASLTSTCEVGKYSATLTGRPSAGGLYDMAGNVWEWTASYSPCRYPLDPLDPTCRLKPDVSMRSVRGGSWWYYYSSDVFAAFRNANIPTTRLFDIGFRCSRTPEANLGGSCSKAGARGFANQVVAVCEPMDGSAVVVVDQAAGIWSSDTLVWAKPDTAAVSLSIFRVSDWPNYQAVPFTVLGEAAPQSGNLRAGFWRTISGGSMITVNEGSFLNNPLKKWSATSNGESCQGAPNAAQCPLP